jgi:uncharacterized protein (DUF433 family)
MKTSMAKEYIEQRDGNYYVAGTRISLDSIVYAFRRGESPENHLPEFRASSPQRGLRRHSVLLGKPG